MPAAGPPYQQKLFDEDPVAPAKQHPGQLPFVDWLKNSDTVFHSSFRQNWEEGPMAHVGSQVAASDRLVQSAANISPRETDNPRGGRNFARRLNQPLAHVSPSDAELNAAEWDIDLGKTRVPNPSDPEHQQQQDTRVAAISEHLRAGRPVGYKNAFEDVGTISALAPRGTLRAWHQDVADAQAQGLDVHPHDVSLAKQQFDPAIAITPKSMGHNVEKYIRRYEGEGYSNPEQQTFFPASTLRRYPEGHPQEHDVIPGSETLFEARHEDAEIDAGDWNSKPYPGRAAGQRADAHIEANPGLERGFGVRDWGRYNWKRGPEAQHQQAVSDMAGQTHMERSHHEAMDKKRPVEKARRAEQSERHHERVEHFKRGLGT